MWIVTGPFDAQTSNDVAFQSNVFSPPPAFVHPFKLIGDTSQSQSC